MSLDLICNFTGVFCFFFHKKKKIGEPVIHLYDSGYSLWGNLSREHLMCLLKETGRSHGKVEKKDEFSEVLIPYKLQSIVTTENCLIDVCSSQQRPIFLIFEYLNYVQKVDPVSIQNSPDECINPKDYAKGITFTWEQLNSGFNLYLRSLCMTQTRPHLPSDFNHTRLNVATAKYFKIQKGFLRYIHLAALSGCRNRDDQDWYFGNHRIHLGFFIFYLWVEMYELTNENEHQTLELFARFCFLCAENKNLSGGIFMNALFLVALFKTPKQAMSEFSMNYLKDLQKKKFNKAYLATFSMEKTFYSHFGAYLIQSSYPFPIPSIFMLPREECISRFEEGSATDIFCSKSLEEIRRDWKKLEFWFANDNISNQDLELVYQKLSPIVAREKYRLNLSCFYVYE